VLAKRVDLRMTSVTAWYEPHDDASWIVADTRISGSVGVLSESGAKIFPLSILCLQPSPSGDFVQKSIFTFGFAFSGSSLPALMTYALSNACLGNLIGAAGAPPPAVSDIAEFICRIAERYCREILAVFEAIILGWCPIAGRYRAFVLRPNEATADLPMQMRSDEVPLYDPECFVLIGSHQKIVSDRIPSPSQRLMPHADWSAAKIRKPSLGISPPNPNEIAFSRSCSDTSGISPSTYRTFL
jgi:hypothetical protein